MTDAPTVLEVRHTLESAGVAARLVDVLPAAAGATVRVKGTEHRREVNVARVRAALHTGDRLLVDDIVGWNRGRPVSSPHRLNVTRVPA